MPEQRIRPEAIRVVKDWMFLNREELKANGINRIDVNYSDEDADLDTIDEILAYWQAGSMISPHVYRASPFLWSIMEQLTTEDNFFQGTQGNGGVFHLMLETCTIEHASFEYETAVIDHEIEVF